MKLSGWFGLFAIFLVFITGCNTIPDVDSLQDLFESHDTEYTTKVWACKNLQYVKNANSFGFGGELHTYPKAGEIIEDIERRTGKDTYIKSSWMHSYPENSRLAMCEMRVVICEQFELNGRRYTLCENREVQLEINVLEMLEWARE